MDQLPLRPNVCMIVISADGRFLIGERAGRPGAWQFPQGGIESGDSEEETVYKELAEELGLSRDHVEIERKLRAKNDYDFREIPEYARGRWRGQTQSFWLVRFLGADEDICVETDQPEFSDWQWIDPHRVLQTVEPIRRDGYQDAISEYLADGHVG